MGGSPLPASSFQLPARRIAILLLCSAAFLWLFFSFELEPSFEPRPTGIVVSQAALRIHREATVIDLHIDSLLWKRDLTVESGGGHVDFPRLRRGGIDGAVFTIPTAFFGAAGLKALHDRWPARTWFSPWERTRFQIDKMQRFRSAADDLLVWHGIEGAHALEDDVHRVHELKAQGVAYVAPVHLTDNDYGGSSLGSNRGLTALGRDLLRELNRAEMLVDLAHASERTFDEAIELTELPPLVSHGGVRAVHDSWRNLDDDQIRRIAERGGVIGIMLAPPALSAPDLEEAIRHIEHVIEVGGEDAVAIGSDFDGYVDPPIDAAGLPQLTELMLRRGFTEERIRKVLGENALRVLSPVLDSRDGE